MLSSSYEYIENLLHNLRQPFDKCVLQGVDRVDGEADEDHLGHLVGYGTEPFVVVLSRRVPHHQLNLVTKVRK